MLLAGLPLPPQGQNSRICLIPLGANLNFTPECKEPPGRYGPLVTVSFSQ